MKTRCLMVMLVTAMVVGAGCGDLPFLKKMGLAVSQPQAPAPVAVAPAPAAVAPQVAPQPEAAVAVGGMYDVRGTNPGGKGNYAGTAMISSTGPDSFRVDWSVGTAYTGTGRRTGNTLSIEWGNGQASVGTVNYIIESDGRLTGSWYTNADPNSLGSEILLPRR